MALDREWSRSAEWRLRHGAACSGLNVQANGNWALLPGGSPHLHVHIYARRRSGKTRAQPVDLPKPPGAFGFAPLAEADRVRLADALTESLLRST